MYTDDDWRNAIINIKDLESLTNYDFLTNLPIQIQKAIKKRTIGEIKGELNPTFRTSVFTTINP